MVTERKELDAKKAFDKYKLEGHTKIVNFVNLLKNIVIALFVFAAFGPQKISSLVKIQMHKFVCLHTNDDLNPGMTKFSADHVLNFCYSFGTFFRIDKSGQKTTVIHYYRYKVLISVVLPIILYVCPKIAEKCCTQECIEDDERALIGIMIASIICLFSANAIFFDNVQTKDIFKIGENFPNKLVCEFELLPDAKNSSMAISSTGKYVRNAEKIRDSTCFDPLNHIYGIIILSAILVMLLMCCCSTLRFIFTLKKICGILRMHLQRVCPSCFELRCFNISLDNFFSKW